MTSRLKALALALIAVFAMSAMVASAAQATPEVTSERSPLTLHGTEEGGVLTAFKGEIKCKVAHYHSPLTATPTSTLTIEPEYTECEAFGLPATVTMNGCDYVFHLKSKVAANHYNATADIVCPEGKQIEVHVYGSATAHKEGKALCTVTIPAQVGLGTITITTKTTEGSNYGDATIEGSVENILVKQDRNSFLCPAGTEETGGKLDIKPFTLTGLGSDGLANDWDISGE